MTEVVINAQYGGFSVSPKALERIAEIRGDGPLYWFKSEVNPEGRGLIQTRVYETPERRAFPIVLAYTTENPTNDDHTYDNRDIERDDPALLQVVKELGREASGGHANLKIIEIPDDVEWQIEEYDGLEWVAEKHRKWYNDT